MSGRTRRLRELIASGECLYMPSAATPLEGRIAELRGRCSSTRAAISPVPLVWVQRLPLGELKEMDYRGCIDAQLMLGAAVHLVQRAVREMVETGVYTGLSVAEFTALRKEIEDLIGLDAYYRIEAETVEPQSQVR